MSPEIITIIALVALFAIATFLPINMGALAFVAAFLVGTLSVGMDAEEILGGFPAELVLTLIGVLVAPAIIILAAGLSFLGYLVATYLVGRALWGWFGALPPDTFLERALTALIGAVAVVLIAMVPFLGWLAILILGLTGLGALAVGVFRPELRTRY